MAEAPVTPRLKLLYTDFDLLNRNFERIDQAAVVQLGEGGRLRPVSGVVEAQNVLDYGADPTGTQDSTLAIQEAIAVAALGGGGIVFFPPGTYRTTSTIAVPNKVWLMGSGPEATIISFQPAGAIFCFTYGAAAPQHGGCEMMTIRLSSPAAGCIRVSPEAHNHCFERLFLVGYGEATGTGIQFDGEQVDNSNHTIHLVRFDTLQIGLRFSGFTDRNLVLNCSFGSMNTAISFTPFGADTRSGQHNLFSQCELTGPTNGIVLTSTATRNVFVKVACEVDTTSITGGAGSDGVLFLGCHTNINPDAGTLGACEFVAGTGFTGGIGIPTYTLFHGQVGIGTISDRDLLIQRSVPGGNVQQAINNTDNTNAASTAKLLLGTGGASAGDPFIQFNLPAVADWSVGLDNSDGDKLKISESFVVGSNDRFVIDKTTGKVHIQTGDLAIETAGKGLQVKEGANAKMGIAVLVGGTVVVSTTAVTADSRILLTSQVDGGAPGFLRVSARTPGTSFTITSSSGTDTSTVAWMLVEPA